MSSAQSLWESFLIMILCLFISVILIFAVLMPGELMLKDIQKTGILDVPEQWQTARNNDFYVSAGYWLTYFISFYGIAQFIWTSVRRQKYDVYGQPIED